ncbi:8559_t:CDS:2 [Funneliformis geosporum]|uniref:GPN-loop GTPase 2 n=1 Tax=Funneliformis geosporum TaxID=1117311 RepID=A0A9W4STA5_9GLOM|nr:8559_t:CDS:2 [Funneliformis geosporum]
MPFGQIVIGPPGSGKTTYCNGMYQFLTATGRKVSVVNLDPANDFLPYTCAVNVAELITLEEAMEELKLGPNGGMMYCMEFLEKNFDWFEEKLKALGDPTKYISVLLLSLKTMLQIELPHINVLSKVDLMESYGKLAFNLDFYTEVQDLSYLLQHLDEDPFARRFKELNKALCGLIEDFSLVGFNTLCIEDKKSVWKLVQVIDKANGYVFGGLTEGNESIMLTTMGTNTSTLSDILEVQERWLDHKETYDEWEYNQQKMEQTK